MYRRLKKYEIQVIYKTAKPLNLGLKRPKNEVTEILMKSKNLDQSEALNPTIWQLWPIPEMLDPTQTFGRIWQLLGKNAPTPSETLGVVALTSLKTFNLGHLVLELHVCLIATSVGAVDANHVMKNKEFLLFSFFYLN